MFEGRSHTSTALRHAEVGEEVAYVVGGLTCVEAGVEIFLAATSMENCSNSRRSGGIERCP